MRIAITCVFIALASLTTRLTFAQTTAPSPRPTGFDNAEVVRHDKLDPVSAACRRAMVVSAQRVNIQRCRKAAVDQTEHLGTLASALTAACTAPPSEIESARQQQVMAGAELTLSEGALALARREIAEQTSELERLTALLAATSGAAETAVVNTALSGAKGNLEKAEMLRDQAAVKAIAAAATDSKSREELVKAEQFEAKRAAMDGALDAVVLGGASPADFEAFLQDQTRHDSCAKVTDALIASYATLSAPKPTDSSDAAEATAAATDAHASDTLRKGSNLPTSVTDATALVENPGAPDAVTFSVMTALGATQETTGTQAILTLNLGSTLMTNKASLTKAPAAARNLFLRAQLPLQATQSETIGEATSVPGSVASVRRFQFVLGTSVFDNSDTRLAVNRSCYLRVIDYLPIASNDQREDMIKQVRKSLYDICNSRAAHEQRLALRAGVGLITAGAGDDAETHAEVIAGAVVWGPTPWLYFNGFYQRLLRPLEVHNLGVGISLARNVGGLDSGVDAWARIGVNAIWIFSIADATDKLVLEGRIAPTVQFKLANAITSLAVGPTLVQGGSTGLLATVAITYDADQLISPLLTPLTSK